MSLRELELRAHVHDLLHDYALTHITTDYIAFTNTAVREVLSQSLHAVPTRDSTCLALEPPLHELIASIFKLSKASEYQEKLDVSPESKLYLKDFLRASVVSGRTQSKSEFCWTEGEHDIPYIRPMSPTLTLQAVRETPRLGNTTARTRVPGPTASLLVDTTIIEADMQNIDAELSTIERAQQNDIYETVLGRKVIIGSDILATLRSFFQQTLPHGRVPKDSATDNAYVSNFLNGNESASPTYDPPRYASPPLFPRDSNPGGPRHGSTNQVGRPHGIQELGSLMQVTEDPDGGEAVDLYKEHMVVVDGWNAYETPASPAASIHFPLSQEEDELAVNKYLLWSSPAADEGRNRFNFEKMDEHELPRSQRIRGSHGQPKSDGQDESLQEMLSFLRPIPKTPQKRAGEPQVVDSHLAVEVKTPRSEPSSPHTTITASLLGQPPTALYSDLDIGSPRSQDLSSDDVGITRLLKKMYKNETGAESGLVVNPQDFILKERLDEKETHLMDVPDLLPPNEHAPSIAYMPTTLRALLAPKQERVSGNAVNSARPLPADYASDCVQDGFLKEIKGFKALFLGLSWRPFDFGPSIPTHEELSRVVDSVQIDCLQDVKTGLNNDDSNAAEDALARLLDDLTVSDNPAAGISQDSSAIPSTQCWLLDQPSLDALATADDPEGFLLTTSERRRLLGLPEQPTTSYSDHGSEDDFVEDRPVKRLRFSSPVEIIEITPRPSFEREPDYHEDAAGDDYLGYVEDSGVFIPDLPRSRLGAISFAQLSDDAQGFEGPSDDGEVIPDVDPVLLDRWDADYTISSIWERPVPDELEYDIRASPQLHNLDGADYATDASPASPREEIAAAEHDVSRQPEPLLVRKDGIPGFPTHRQAVRLPADELPIFQGTRISTVSNNENLLQGQSARQSLQEFMRIRSRQVIAPPDVPSQSPVAPAARDTVSDDIPIAVPSELVDRHTLTLPAPRSTPRPVHRYLASLDFIQRRALVRALAAPACAVQLTEREDLDGADLVLDADTAVVFSSLRTLPGRCDVLTARVGRLSWRFAHLLVVFEAFPPGDAPAHALVDGTLAVNPFSPPVIKVVKKLKRDIALAEACYDKRAETSVQLAFPLTLADAAQSVRVFGDLAEERDVTRGALWGERPWLELEDEDLDERDLAAIDGMNAFAAAVVLSSASLDDFLERTPDERLEAFGDLVGRHRIETFNTVIARRRQAMELPSSSPPISSKSPASMEVATTGYQHDAVPGWAE